MKTYRYVLNCCALVGVALLLGAGCNNISADQACTDESKAQCALLDKCRTNGTQLVYGNLGTCISRLKASCLTALMAPSAGNDPGAVEGCATALPSETCQDYLQGNPVAACIPRNGGVQSGAACAFNTQCNTGFCAVKKGSTCGVCQMPPVVGDPCTEIGCGRNLVCTPNQVCGNWVVAGQPCDTKNNVCAPGLACVIPAAQTSGACQPKGKTVGAACDNKRQTGADCDANAGLFCDAVTLKCAAQTYANATQDCGLGPTGSSDVLCNAGGSCVSMGVGSPSTCVAAAQEGNSCDTAMGPPCLAPARCMVSTGSTSGTCTLLDAKMCM